jgi:uncharacterized protein (DUF1800 family)
VMELFALGEGHYTEKDIAEAARALTGWSLERQAERFMYRPRLHDDGQKTFLGRAGNFAGEDIIRIIVEQPQAARFITAKLWNYFAGQMPAEAWNTELAARFHAGGNEFKPLLREMFQSESFYAPDIIRNQVKSPVQWLVSSVRMLECELPPPLVSWGLLRQIGQDLFAPPNVKGWDGGVTWITTNTLLTRYNDAQSLVEGTLPPLGAGDFARKAGNGGGGKAMKALQRLRLGGVNAEKILTPEGARGQAGPHRRAGKTAVPDRAQGGAGADLARISRFQNQDEQRGHFDGDPADDVHAGVSDHLTSEA